MMLRKFVTQGDITRVYEIDAIVTLINPDGMWFGGVDGAIQRVAGGYYHNQVAQHLGHLENGQVVVAKGSRNDHRGSFNDVIFVVDTLASPLSHMVESALGAAKEAGHEFVALPLMRTGVMLGVVEVNLDEVVKQMVEGLDKFENGGETDMRVIVVIYDNPEAAQLLANTQKFMYY